MHARAAIACLLCGLVVAMAGVADAGQVYRWKDSNGVVHYGDRPPDAQAQARQLKVIPVRAEPGAIVRLRVENDQGTYLAWAENTLSGPIEVMLHFSHERNVAGAPALPARATVPANGRALVTRIDAIDPVQPGEFELSLQAIPGSPGATPRDVEYLLPLQQSDLRIYQGYGGSFSHTDPQNRYAVDFGAEIGTPVIAARDGMVMQVESDFDKAGLNREQYGGRANFVRIVHDDGTMALYAHLKQVGAMVRVGQRVRAGQRIGLSGNTGFTTGPHLHFVVQVNRGMRLESIPFRMFGPQGILRFTENR